MSLVDVTSNLSEVRARFTAMATGAEPTTRGILGARMVTFGHRAKSIVQAHTPVSRIGPPSPGVKRLVDTAQEDPLVVGPAGYSLAVRETKTITFRKGGNIPLYQLLTEGHAAPAQPIRPVFAKALRLPWGFRMSSKGGSAEPNPYGEDARREIAPLFTVTMREAGTESVRAVLA